MDVRLAIASKRDRRDYADRAIPHDVVERILDAGRLSGSARNQQPWRFLVAQSHEVRQALAGAVFVADNVLTAGLVVAIVVSGKGPVSFDAGRAAQNMMLAAWGEGVASCPNGIADRDGAAQALGLELDDQLGIVLSFGYSERQPDPERRTADEWSARANREPLDALVRRL